MGAALMLGWTVLLLWADRKPLERRGILPITVLPVVAGLMINEGYAVFGSGFLSLPAVAPIWILQSALSALFLVSYFKAGKSGYLARTSEPDAPEKDFSRRITRYRIPLW
jgi:hypothetical protein